MSDPRHDLVNAAREVYEAGLVNGRAGNLSARLPGGRIIISPSGGCLGRLAVPEPVVIDESGQALDGGTPSTEYRVHLAIYAARPDVEAIVHTHSTYATVLAYLGRLILDVNPETAEVLGPVGSVPALPHGTDELAAAVVAGLSSGAAVLLEKHGALTVGPDIAAATERAQYLEEAAKMTYLINLAGGA